MWIFLEGLDRTGKTTVAEVYEKKGFEVVHMEAPDKKYSNEDYAGPTYFEDMMELYMKYIGKNVVFDRSTYGELVWSKVYNRRCLLSEQDIIELREIELDNFAEYTLMVDEDLEGHWKRCVDNNEPLTKYQFTKAHNIYGEIAVQYEFTKRQLPEFLAEHGESKLQDKHEDDKESQQVGQDTGERLGDSAGTVRGNNEATEGERSSGESPEQLKLKRANVINEVLSKKIIRKNGPIYEDIESEIRGFLNGRLSELFGKGESEEDALSGDEITILKEYCKIIKNKQRRK